MSPGRHTGSRDRSSRPAGSSRLFGRVVGLAGVDLQLLPRRGARGHRRQRCRQVDADQVPVRRDDARRRRAVRRRQAGSASSNTQDAREAGIETVYQTLAVAPALDIASNLFLAREIRAQGPARLGAADARQRRHEAAGRASTIKNLGISTLQNINQAVETLSGGQRQAVAVARAGAFGSKVVILDEPTAALGVRETGQVLDWSRTCATRAWASS